MSEFDTFGITLSVADWRALLDLAQHADRSPSDYLRILIREAACQVLDQGPDQEGSLTLPGEDGYGNI